MKTLHHLTLRHIATEPFRVFFPAGVLSGILGVVLWPLHLQGIIEFYPGQVHSRIMAYGLFGGFIFGFLGTAMPRMLSAQAFRLWEVLPLLFLHLAMVFAFVANREILGDELFLGLLAGFFVCIGRRIPQRKDLPPPGFVLVALAFVCVSAGAVLSLVQRYREMDVFWIILQRLLSSQGFVLLPILGIGPFILPRLFGRESPHDFPEALAPNPAWLRKALIALLAGLLVIGSFVAEAAGWYRLGHAVRFATTLIYLFFEMPLHRGAKESNALGIVIRIAFLAVLGGFLAVSFLPAYRIGLLHLTLIGGFATITFVVATRVVFGHSGNSNRLKGRNSWLLVAVGLMLLGMATRISGDLWPKLMASHYTYGALLWIVGVLLWFFWVLPKVLIADPED